jgi:hypothetical protein
VYGTCGAISHDERFIIIIIIIIIIIKRTVSVATNAQEVTAT